MHGGNQCLEKLCKSACGAACSCDISTLTQEEIIPLNFVLKYVESS